MKKYFLSIVLLSMLISFAQPQQTLGTNTDPVVPPLVNFSGALTDADGKPLTSITGVTFLLYKESQGGAPLWLETQNVQPDENGHYTVMLGSTSSQGLPADIFVAGEAHWLAVQISGQPEQARVLLVAVPYALKAGDAQTIGGLPPSAFVLAAPGLASMAASTSASVSGTTLRQGSTVPAAQDVTTAGGTVNAIPLFDAVSDISNSAISQTGTGTTAKIGIGTTAPASTLDIKGGSTVRGTLSLPAMGVASATAGKNSQAETMAASAFNSSTSTAATQTFQWQAEPAGNNTATATGSLNLLFGQGTSKPAETGFHIASNGQITFATGQTFPGAGTITGVTAGTDLTGGGTSGNPTLNLDTTKVPQLAAANTFTGNQTVNGNLAATGMISGSSFQIGSNLFDYGSYANANTFTGFAGNTTMTGANNTGSGVVALFLNSTGSSNTANGSNALAFNTSGSNNTAIGMLALFANSTGANNTASGMQALASNSAGFNNTANGYQALTNNTGTSPGTGRTTPQLGR